MGECIELGQAAACLLTEAPKLQSGRVSFPLDSCVHPLKIVVP